MSGYDDWLAAPYDDAPECPNDCGDDWCNCAEELDDVRAEARLDDERALDGVTE